MISCDDFLAQGCRQLGLELTSEQLAHLCRYYGELDKWSKKMNLVARADREEILTSHFLDSLTLLPHLPQNDCRLLDIGSGAGFPGLVLKAVSHQLQVTLVEPRGKRVAFLRHIIRTLALTGVTVVGERLEADAAMVARLGPFDLVTSRAFADMTVFLTLAAPYCRPGGLLICMKGRKVEEELAAWQQDPLSAHLTLVDRKSVTLPGKPQHRSLVIFQKNDLQIP